MKFSKLKIAFLISVGFIKPAMAENLCAIALESQAFNTVRSNTNEAIAMAKRNDLCSKKYNSAQEARNAASSSGLDVGFKGFQLGKNDSSQTGNSKISIESSDFCNATEEDFKRSFGSNYDSQIADVALRAWSSCVEQNSNQFYIKYTPSRDGKYLSGAIIRKVSRGGLVSTITGMSVVGAGKSGLSCYIGAIPVVPGPLEIRITTSSTALLCEKPSEEGVVFSFQTSDDALPSIEMPKQSTEEFVRYEQIERQLIFLNAAAAKLSDTALIIGEIRSLAISEKNSTAIKALLNSGWVPADGRTLSRAAYPGLATALGETWGRAPNATDFMVPDLRGMFVRGYAGASSRDPDAANRIAFSEGGSTGNSVGSLELDAFQKHKHNDGGHAHALKAYSGRGGAYGYFDQSVGADSTASETGYAMLGDPVNSGTGGGNPRLAIETRPTNVTLYYFVYAGKPIHNP
ncbi:phage tail protein [Sphingomonas sp.]|jgi:microcystin-dependent protein|uniref:phage tail protein n=1 Tax=Sphingomonas sp. TaxID=28214 RepID=UPI002EDA1EAA